MAETEGFDFSTRHTWIYPENYPIRQYQFNIIKSALYRNTLVRLPTGLGKSFIAAVVMYNFWRWYPNGKIIFLVPTKALVAQQIDVCYEVTGIPSTDMIELTGAVNRKDREIAWGKKRIIFTTDEVFRNDLEKSSIPSNLIKCVVVDEAHKAFGKHSYCECIRILSTQNQYFRILALSASTFGNKVDNVREVIRNLNISHLELRDENSTDIKPYVIESKVDIILVPLSDELAAFKERYVIIMDRYVQILKQYNVLRGHTANISEGRISSLIKEFKKKTDKSGNYGKIMMTLTILLTMYHAYELMIRHGLRAFCKFYETHSDKFWMHNEDRLRNLLHDIKTYLGPFPKLFPNGDVSEMPTDIVFGHNKFYKLKELLEHHFNNNNGERKDTRAVVFVETRDIANEVYILLLQSKPIIRPQMFLGQVSQKQEQQMKAFEDFRSNRVNVLISTFIGEEGLDVGEIDLIIYFGASQHSPIRLVQRMGRTGRKRDGHIIGLVTDGQEHENLKSTLTKRDSLNNEILNTSNICSSLYDNNPRMIPDQFTPECYKMHITVLPKTPSVKGIRQTKNIKKRGKNRKRKNAKNRKIERLQKMRKESRNPSNIFIKTVEEINAMYATNDTRRLKNKNVAKKTFNMKQKDNLNETSIDNNEVRFEDILDMSSNSSDAASELNQGITNIDKNLINTSEASTSNMKEDNKIITNTKLSTNTLEDLEPTIFEDILNESFSSVEDDLENVEQNIVFLDDSDEDFMITEENAKKFNELESCYFRNLSKDSENDGSCMPSTSKNLEVRNNHSDNISKNLETKDDCSDSTLKNLKPCGVSTPKSDKRARLSLKRNRTQQGSGRIDLNFFKAPDKYVTNTKDKNLLKSSSDTPKQIFSLNEKIAQKNTRRLKDTNAAKNEFLDDEAEVDFNASSDETVVTDDEDIADFVSYTQIPQDQDMHAHYLQTIKSPVKRPGAFHFREPRLPDPDIEIYTQSSPRVQDTYLYDSFCVAGDVDESSVLIHSDSLLDKIEKELEKNKRKRSPDKDMQHTKKKKIRILNHSKSSEDEVNLLRIQVQED